VFVSHDRYFIDNLATRVFEIEDGHVHVYPGTYEDYMWRKQGGPETLAAIQQKDAEPVPVPAPAVPAAEEPKKRVNPMKVQKLRDRLKLVEQDVAKLESTIATTEEALGDFKSVDETKRLSDLAESSREALEARLKEWEEITAELEGAS
jgi:ATP-binding cassette subfamily F protein 3